MAPGQGPGGRQRQAPGPGSLHAVELSARRMAGHQQSKASASAVLSEAGLQWNNSSHAATLNDTDDYDDHDDACHDRRTASDKRFQDRRQGKRSFVSRKFKFNSRDVTKVVAAATILLFLGAVLSSRLMIIIFSACEEVKRW